MQEYVKNLSRRFGTVDRLADFMGVSHNSVWSWQAGRRQPTGPALRLLQVMGVALVKAPWLFETWIPKDDHQALPALPSLPALPELREDLVYNLAVKQVHVNAGLLGRSKQQWLIEYDDEQSQVMLDLSDEDYDRVLAYIGKKFT